MGPWPSALPVAGHQEVDEVADLGTLGVGQPGEAGVRQPGEPEPRELVGKSLWLDPPK